jgi:hypothetical protein
MSRAVQNYFWIWIPWKPYSKTIRNAWLSLNSSVKYGTYQSEYEWGNQVRSCGNENQGWKIRYQRVRKKNHVISFLFIYMYCTRCREYRDAASLSQRATHGDQLRLPNKVRECSASTWINSFLACTKVNYFLASTWINSFLACTKIDYFLACWKIIKLIDWT